MNTNMNILNVTFLVIIPTKYGAIIPGKVAKVLPIPNTTPEYVPAMSLQLTKNPAPQPHPLKIKMYVQLKAFKWGN